MKFRNSYDGSVYTIEDTVGHLMLVPKVLDRDDPRRLPLTTDALVCLLATLIAQLHANGAITDTQLLEFVPAGYVPDHLEDDLRTSK